MGKNIANPRARRTRRKASTANTSTVEKPPPLHLLVLHPASEAALRLDAIIAALRRPRSENGETTESRLARFKANTDRLFSAALKSKLKALVSLLS